MPSLRKSEMPLVPSMRKSGKIPSGIYLRILKIELRIGDRK
jgi:hypothetical protein